MISFLHFIRVFRDSRSSNFLTILVYFNVIRYHAI